MTQPPPSSNDMVLPPRNGLSLRAGGGGLDMGLGLAEPGFATSLYVEIDDYPRQTIIAGQQAGYLHPAPIWDDLKRFSGRPWRGQIDTLLAGYPCQPFSQAGQRKGENDPRHLWPDIERIIKELGPGLRWIFLENVAGHITLGLEAVLRALRSLGFSVAVGLFSAEETGAPHERQRAFIVAYRESNRGHAGKLPLKTELVDADGRDPSPEREQRRREQRFQPKSGSDGKRNKKLADPKRDAGHQGGRRYRHDQETDNSPTPDRPRTPRPHLSPPAPSDPAGWEFSLAHDPERAPAVSLGDLSTFARYFAALVEAGNLSQTEAESRLCRMADGLATRSRALRLLGNGVHPLAAAYAWRTLSAAHGLGRVGLDASA